MSQVPFQLLELTVISAQDLAPVSKNLRTYGVAWVDPERKLRTRIDQHGQTSPMWNDKFVFRVDDKFLSSESSAVVIEIYALGWLRDIPVGSVTLLIPNLLPPPSAIRKQSNSNSSSRRFVALEIRRPSGRRRGILNISLSLLDNTMRSMPLYSELGASTVGFRDLIEPKTEIKNEKTKGKGKVQLWRSRSDRTDLNSPGVPKKEQPNKPSSICNGSIANGSVVNGGSEVGAPMRPVGGNGSICSDGGPSPSVVAAAVAKGLYPKPMMAAPPHKGGSSILGDWTVEESSVEGLKTKIERWRMELPPMYDRRDYQKIRKSPQRHSRRHTDGGGGGGGGGGRLFSCFGNAYGCEFTIVCGGNGSKKNSTSKRYYGSSISPSDIDS